MKNEALITSLVTVLLNTTWSIVFDLLPNIVDFSLLGGISLSKYLLLIPFLLLINLGALLSLHFIFRKELEKETFKNQIKVAIDKLIEDEAKGITERSPVIMPGPAQAFLKYYKDLIIHLEKYNGKIEFEVDSPPPQSFDFSKPILISNITPGMFKYFMVITQGSGVEFPDLIRISPDFEGTPQEFTYTWFDKIFPLLGNMSEKISAKMDALPNLPESLGHYEIREYKFIKKKKKHFIRISVI